MNELVTPPDFDTRLARLETQVESVAASVGLLADQVRTIATSAGRPNWGMLGVCASVLFSVGGACAFAVFGPISANFERIRETRAELSSWIVREQDRNNQLEREMGAAQMIDQLFMAGKLRLEP